MTTALKSPMKRKASSTLRLLFQDGELVSNGACHGVRRNRLLVVDANGTFRAGLRHEVEGCPGMVVIGEASSGAEALESVLALGPDIVLVDVHLPDLSGIEVCRRVVSLGNSPVVLVMSNLDWDIYLAGAWRAGASGFLLKSTEPSGLVQSIQLGTKQLLFTEEQVERVRRWGSSVGERLTTLGVREWEVLRLVASGHSNRQIAVELALSESTVEKHVNALFKKLGTRSRTGLLAFILQNHLETVSGLVTWRKTAIRKW